MMMTYLLLAWEFFKTGLFAVGGGLATLPFLYDISARRGWFSLTDISNMVAISESTPGPMGINMATFVGFSSFGFIGTLLAPLSLVLPSIVIIIMVAKALSRFRDSKLVKDIFSGLRPASLAMITAAGLSVAKLAFLKRTPTLSELFSTPSLLADIVSWKAVVLAVVVFFAMKKWKLHPILFIVLSAAVGVIFQF